MSPDDKPSSSLVINQPTSTSPKPASVQVLFKMNQAKYDNCMWIEYYNFNFICHPVEAAVSNAKLESAGKREETK